LLEVFPKSLDFVYASYICFKVISKDSFTHTNWYSNFREFLSFSSIQTKAREILVIFHWLLLLFTSSSDINHDFIIAHFVGINWFFVCTYFSSSFLPPTGPLEFNSSSYTLSNNNFPFTCGISVPLMLCWITRVAKFATCQRLSTICQFD